VIAALGLALGVINNSLYPIIVAVSAITTFSTPYFIKLANHLAEKSFKNKNNISKHLRYEFLLWLSSKKDISSAFSTTMPGDCDYLVICFGKKTPIFGTKKALTLKKEANPLDLEKISLSRLL
jgi:tRNA threonylcarbamoyladenosine modification (KEOPS) complex Cgi121 subunit